MPKKQIVQALSYPQKVGFVCEYLAAVRESRWSPTAVWHPYGFLVVKLPASDAQVSMRLHIWPTQERITQVPHWPIHSHPWSMVSSILCGELINESFEVSRCGQNAAEHQLYRVRYKEKCSMLEATNISVVYRSTSRLKYCSGDEYELGAGCFHTTEVSQGMFASSIVVTDAHPR